MATTLMKACSADRPAVFQPLRGHTTPAAALGMASSTVPVRVSHSRLAVAVAIVRPLVAALAAGGTAQAAADTGASAMVSRHGSPQIQTRVWSCCQPGGRVHTVADGHRAVSFDLDLHSRRITRWPFLCPAACLSPGQTRTPPPWAQLQICTGRADRDLQREHVLLTDRERTESAPAATLSHVVDRPVAGPSDFSSVCRGRPGLLLTLNVLDLWFPPL